MKPIQGIAILFFIGGAAGLVMALSRPALRSAPLTQPAGRDNPQAAAPSFAGTLSCSARACHGRDEPIKDAVAQQNEYTSCLMYDKHMQAYRVLFDPRALRMAENLAPTNKDGRPIPPHRDERCLACHVTPALAFQPDPTKDADPHLLTLRDSGVSCEACHGPALKQDKPWLTQHTVPGEWREKYKGDPSKKEEYGFTNLSDLGNQARVCAGCHVGAPPGESHGLAHPARDLNHDLMAAGHPRLTFEFTAHRANMPPH